MIRAPLPDTRSTPTDRRRPVRLLLISLTVALLTACGSEPEGSAPDDESVPVAERYGGTLVIAVSADLQTMMTLTTSDLVSRNVQMNLLFMPLVMYGPDRMPHPYLAERWDTTRAAGDSLDLTMHLRRDIRWHDGVPTTADDVLFTFERAIDSATGSTIQSNFDLWSRKAEVIDSFTIRFRLKPHEEFFSVLSQAGILPRHILGEVPAAELVNHPYGQRTPMGNGPFRFLRRQQGQEWVFEANPDFPAGLGGRPYLDRVVIRVIPDATARLTEFLTGQVDVMEPVPNQVDAIEAEEGVVLLSGPSRRYVYLGFNTQDPLFQDARVRRAMSLAIDRQAIVDAVLHGQGEVGVSTTTPIHWPYDDAYRALSPRLDRDQARRLLVEAGWNPGADGVIVNADGQPFRFQLIVAQQNEIARDALPIVQAQLRQVGIAAEPRSLETNTFFAMLDGTPLPGGGRDRDFQAVIAAWNLEFRQDDTPFFHSRAKDAPYAETGFNSPRTDALIDTLGVLLDRQIARPLWQQYHQLLLEQAPYSTLMYPNPLFAHNRRVRGVEFDVRGAYADIREWWIPAADRN